LTAQVIVGGLGVSGLGCALELARRGIEFVALEKDVRPGGLARSESAGPFRFDYGPHIVLGVPAPLQVLLADLPGLDLRARSGRSCIALDDTLSRVVPAPFQRHLSHLPLAVRARLLLELAAARGANGKHASTYSEYAIARCGRSVFERFLRGYESKRLRFSLDDIPPDWTDRVPRPSVRSLVRPRWAPRLRHEGGAESTFSYPRTGGIEALPRALSCLLPTNSVRCETEIVEIDAERKQLDLSHDGTVSYEQLVLTLPLPEIVRLLKDPPGSLLAAAENLVYTSIYVISLGVEEPLATPWTFIRFPGDALPFYRVSVPSLYSTDSAPEGHGVVVAEVSHHPTRHRLEPGEAADGARRGLTELGILRRGQRILVEWVHDIRYGHVVYNHRTRESVRTVLEYLNRRSIYTCGKYGLWQDMLMTGSIMTGMDVARRIGDGVEPGQKNRSSSAIV
jgi:protoporphyrinogen oxidase